MNYKAMVAAVCGAVALFAFSGSSIAAEASKGYMNQNAGRAKARYYRKRPLQVSIYRGRRIGGYSYSAADTTSTNGSSPPPYVGVRQTPSGPFDSGFFFDSGIGLHGGNSPYQH